MFKKRLSLESAIGAAVALTIWILVIAYFCIFQRRRSNVDEAIIEIMKQAVKEAREEKRLAEDYLGHRSPKLHRTLIARDADMVTMRGSRKFGRWDTVIQESWDDVDLARWSLSEDDTPGTISPSCEILIDPAKVFNVSDINLGTIVELVQGNKPDQLSFKEKCLPLSTNQGGISWVSSTSCSDVSSASYIMS